MPRRVEGLRRKIREASQGVCFEDQLELRGPVGGSELGCCFSWPKDRRDLNP